jgi:BirA family biotin operon repressor/biotin-[acetyl-CoA-carboxylase] ligase
LDNFYELLNNNHFVIQGKPIHCFEQASSTNIIAKQMAEKGAFEGAVIISEEQTSGRGRLNREWSCPYGKGLLMSLIVRPRVKAALLPQLTLITAVAVCNTMVNLANIEAGIKWPNDILVNGKKVCGILAEAKLDKNLVDYAVVGIGINVNLTEADFPSSYRAYSTSLLLETGKSWSRFTLLSEFLSVFDHHYHLFLREGFEYVKSKWLDYNITLGRTVKVSKTDAVIEGTAVGINENGGLLVRLADGRVEEFMAGDVTIGTKQFGHH